MSIGEHIIFPSYKFLNSIDINLNYSLSTSYLFSNLRSKHTMFMSLLLVTESVVAVFPVE